MATYKLFVSPDIEEASPHAYKDSHDNTYTRDLNPIDLQDYIDAFAADSKHYKHLKIVFDDCPDGIRIDIPCEVVTKLGHHGTITLTSHDNCRLDRSSTICDTRMITWWNDRAYTCFRRFKLILDGIRLSRTHKSYPTEYPDANSFQGGSHHPCDQYSFSDYSSAKTHYQPEREPPPYHDPAYHHRPPHGNYGGHGAYQYAAGPGPMWQNQHAPADGHHGYVERPYPKYVQTAGPPRNDFAYANPSQYKPQGGNHQYATYASASNTYYNTNYNTKFIYCNGPY